MATRSASFFLEILSPLSPILSQNWKHFFCLGTQPSQFIEVLNSGILHPYQHVKHKINLTIRPGITLAFLKFLHLVDTDSWRHLLHQLVRFSHAFPLDSFSRTARTRSTFSADNYRRWEKTKTSDILKL